MKELKRKMNIEWKDIFNCKKVFPEPFSICQKIARECGYDYMCFDDLIFLVSKGDIVIGTQDYICKVEDLNC